MNKILHKKFFFECFYKYNEFFLFFHVFRLKINMPFIIFRNFSFFVQCNDIRIKLIRVIQHVLKTEIINNKFKNEKILISRILLFSKNDEISKNRKKIVLCQFNKIQFFVRFVFVIIINKFQN